MPGLEPWSHSLGDRVTRSPPIGPLAAPGELPRCRSVAALTESDRVRRHVWIDGRVQNVWFRDACRREALAHGVDGWVQNLGDGRVEAVFEGPPDAVTVLVAWCQDGPPRAKVDRVDVRDELPGAEQGFAVR